MMKKSILALIPALALIAATSAQAQTTNIYSNAYSGGTIGSGTTSLITNGATITGDITDNGNLLFMQSSAITNTRSLTGNGMVTQSGTGTTVLNPTGLNAINNFAGGFTVNRGLLDITAAASTTSFANATVNGGVLNMTANLTSMTNLTVNSGRVNLNGTYNNSASAPITIGSGTLSLNKQDVFGTWEANIATPITINAGGVLQNGTNSANNGYVYNTLGAVTLNGGTIQSLGTNGNNSSGTAFGLKGAVSVTGSGTSTITGAGFALGEAAVTSTTFDVANGATLNVTGNLVNGDDASAFLYAGWGNKHPSSLIKTNGGTMILSGTNTYTGTTTVGGGLLEFANTNSLYNGTTASWTANNITVSNGATLAFAVGGAGQFTTSNITTILSNLGGTSGKGFLSNSSIGFDVAGGNFTLTNNLGNSTNGTLGLLAYGANTLTVTGSNSYTGTTRIDSATILQVGNGGTSGTIGSGTVSNSGSLIFNRSGTLSVTAPITGTGDVRQIGLGTTTLTGINSYTGTTTVSAGVLNIGNSGTGNLVIDSGTGHSTNLLVNGGTLNNASGIIGNGVGTVGSVTVTSGSWNNSDFLYIGYYGSSSNSLTISNGGTVRVADTDGWLGLGEYGGSANNLTVTGSNSTLWVNTSRYGSYGIWIGDGYDGDEVASSSNTMVVSAGGKVYSGGESGIGGSGAGVGNTALVTGTGSLWSNNGALNIGGAYLGSTSEGALTVTKGGSVVANDIYIANNAGTVGVLNIGSLGGTDTAGTVTASTIQFGDGTGSINFNQRDATTIDSQISGSGSVNQLGTGTTTLGGANTYTGLTKISVGTLALGAGGSLATNNSVQIDIGAKFDLSTRNQSLNNVKANGTIAGSGTMTVTGTLSGSGTVAADTVVTGTHSPGNSPGIQTFGGNLTYSAGAGILLQFNGNTTNNSPVNYDQILVGNNLNFNGLTTLNLDFGDTGSVVDWNNAFWQSSQSWTLYSVSGTTAGFANLTLNTTNWTDASGDLFGNVLSGGTFSLAQNGNNVVLNYAVPEPSTYALMGLGALVLVIAYRRKSQQAGS